VEVINSSTCPLISKLLRDPDEAAAAASAGKAKKKATTLGFQFKSSLEGLMTSLYRCEPHFVRCMKSNHQKKGNVFESDMMMAQLRYAGLLEVCRIRKIGFPVRKKFDEFIFRYRCLDLSNSKDHVKLCKSLEEKKLLKPRQWVIGHTKVFMRNLQQQELEEAREASLVHVVMKMQAVAKRFIYYTRYKKFVRILRTIRDAIATRTEEALDAALSEAPELPWGGAHVGVVKEARALKERLEDERRVTGLCTEAIKARDLAELRSACKAAEDIVFDSPVVRQAVALRDLMERERAAVKALKAATEARDLDKIVAALAAAGEAPSAATNPLVKCTYQPRQPPPPPPFGKYVTDTDEYRAAVALRERILAENAARDALVKAMKARDLPALTTALAKVHELSLREDVVTEAEKLKEELEEQKRAVEELAEAIKERTLDGVQNALKRAKKVGVADDQPVVVDGKKLEARLLEEKETEDELSAAADARVMDRIEKAIAKAAKLGMPETQGTIKAKKVRGHAA